MFRHVRWQATLIVAGILILAALMAYLALSFTVRYVPAPGGTYIEGVVGQPQFINPLLCSFNEPDRDICALVFNGLVKFDERGAPQPDLASRWTISQDDENYGLIYTFQLRDDVTWQDGQPFTADDVIFTIGLLQDPSFPGRPDIGALWRSVEAVKIDDRTVQITLQEPFAPFLDYAAVGMLPVHILNGVSAGELLDHPFNQQPLGTGPFHVKELVSEPGQPQRIVLETNPRYFGRQPYINEVEFKYYATAAEAFEAYRAGEIHGISPITAADLDLVRETPSLNLFTAPISGLSLIFLNTNDPNSPFFQEEDVRKALLLALDRQAIVDGALGAQAVVANGPFHQNSWAYDPDTPPIEQDISRARQLLARAGWIPSEDVTGSANGDDSDLLPEADRPVAPRIETRRSDALRLKSGVPLSFTLLVSSDQVGVARAVANQWRVIGVNAEVRPVQIGLASNFLQARQYQAALANVVFDSPDPDPYPFWHETKASAGQNYSQFKDRDVSEVLEAARRVVDPTRRAELYRRFAQMFNEKVPAIVLYYPVYSYGVSQRIRGVQLGPLLTPADRLQTLADWFVIERRVIANSGQLTP
ncbi:MAG TPA: ABC transporter substrate-binding protein [Anaerolineae bacterium]|nr:ABC transporter substrate-binding protein [Anaerolineae bacterium]